MAGNPSNKPQSKEKEHKFFGFSDAVNWYLKEKKKTPAELVNLSTLSKTTISRIMRNNNDKGSIYVPTIRIVMTISLALKLTHEEAKELLFAAFPEMAYWSDFLDRRLDVFRANEILDENGLTKLGNPGEE